MSGQLLFTIVGLGMIAYGLVQLGFKIRDYIRHERAVDRMIDKGEVPADYDVVEIEQKRLNKRDEVGKIDIDYEDDVRRKAVSRTRENVASIRESGYIVGERHQLEGVPFDEGVRATPFQQGSGEAKQWVRGYCMGRNVIDIKQYYDAA